MSDRGRDTSQALTEVRTVLSRAEHALRVLQRGPTEWRYNSDGRPDFDWEGHWPKDYDPDHAEMVEALEKAVGLLAQWRRTGRPRK